MTDSQEDSALPGSKRRRLRGSCDICKHRKIKCNSAQMPGNRCTNCIAFNSECTHSLTPVSKKSAPRKASPSQNTPENQANHKSAKAHVATIVVQATTYIAEADVRQVLLDVARYARSLENQLTGRQRSPSLPSAGNSPSPQATTKQEEDDFLTTGVLSERFERFRLDSDVDRYFGKSSHFELINTAMGLKQNFVEEHALPKTVLPSTKRQEFWLTPWEHEHLTLDPVFPPLVFPDPDLLQDLVSLFFSKVNIFLCLIHRPTFEKSLASGLHLRDYHFGSTVLGICAVSAKYSDDPRVVLEGTSSSLSSGWEYYRQLRPLQKALVRACTLYEAQTLCLCVFYLQGSSAPDGCWTIGGAGMRFAQEVGAHRRNRFENKMEAEQWKRVFWVLVIIDTLTSSFCGRPRSTTSSDYDLDYPAECDDEYWETDDPAMAFKQPPGKPSVVSYTIAYLKLIEIIGVAQQTIYRVNHKDESEEWMKDVVANLDSSLNAWVDTIPTHLLWDPHKEDPIFSAQSAVLYACYYHAQIQIHRIFIGAAAKTLNYPSLAICASSARACSHVMDVAAQRGFLCNPHILNAVFDAGIVLLLNVWGGRCAGISVDPQKCLSDVEMCLRVFRAYEPRWQVAGRQHDIITELMGATHMEHSYAPNPLKRRLEYDTEPSTTGSSPESDPQPSTGESSPDSRFGPSYDSPSDQPFGHDSSAFGLDPLFSLPMHTEDLGRLPVYEPLNWAENWGKNTQDDIFLPDDIRNIIAPSEGTPPYSNEAVNPTLLPAMLSDTPAGYDWNEWGKYITNVEEFMQSFGNPTA
ncbi:fungal-specific transcription factor domain-containing protein [Mycena galericulata]|nr:fungal-specific transcription factor domain-containing protein [Mycena galericulata]